MAEEKNKSDGNGIFLPYDQFGRLCYALAHAKTTMYDNEHTIYDIIRILAAGGDIGSTPVLSVNGQTGDVEITAEDINCSAKDTSNSTVTFESGDSKTDKTYTDINVLSSEEKHSTLFNKISIMIKNIRYIWSLIGNTNISSISDGTIRGAIYKLNDECMKKEVYKSDCDFNELNEPGFYILYNPTANSPNSSIDYYSVEVINTKSGGSGGRHLVQIAISKDSYEIYIRYLSGYNYNSSTGQNEDTWLAWRRILGEINVDDTLSSTSTNPVQNKVIKAALDGKAASVAVDSSLSSTSTNPVQNKVVDAALESKANISIYGDTFVSCGRKSETTVGNRSFAFGASTTASGSSSHAEGYYTTASGDYSHAEGSFTTASVDHSHAEGYYTTASGITSHSEGCRTTASVDYSHAEGYFTTASGDYGSHAEGHYTTASNFASHAGGKYNAAMTTGGSNGNTTGHAFVIGKGTSSSALSNAFSVMYSGVVKAASTITASTTADYAEFFEWEDGNPDAEDRVGKFVTINGDKISIATSNEDYILGIVSGEPFVLGNGDCDTWNGMYLRDEFGRTILEPAPKIEIDEETGEEKEVLDEDGNVIYEGTRPVLNPEYDPTQPYISRFDRPEWSPVGMLGVLSVVQDGTCKVNGYCCCNSEGIATSCDRNTEGACRIIEVINDKVVRVIFR